MAAFEVATEALGADLWHLFEALIERKKSKARSFGLTVSDNSFLISGSRTRSRAEQA